MSGATKGSELNPSKPIQCPKDLNAKAFIYMGLGSRCFDQKETQKKCTTKSRSTRVNEDICIYPQIIYFFEKEYIKC